MNYCRNMYLFRNIQDTLTSWTLSVELEELERDARQANVSTTAMIDRRTFSILSRESPTSTGSVSPAFLIQPGSLARILSCRKRLSIRIITE